MEIVPVPPEDIPRPVEVVEPQRRRRRPRREAVISESDSENDEEPLIPAGTRARERLRQRINAVRTGVNRAANGQGNENNL